MGGLKLKVAASDGNATIALSGVLDESSADALKGFDASKTKKHVVIDCRGITAVNSLGVRSLVGWVDSLHHYTTFEYEACPPVLAEMMSLLRESLYARLVTSIEVPYACGQCRKEELPLFRVAELPESLDLGPLVCPHCQGTMQPSLDTANYLGFLRET